MPNFYPTKRQRQLLELIGRRLVSQAPCVQRDFAEQLGIRRDSLNKLLRRLRQRLEAQGKALQMPDRCRSAAAALSALVDDGAA